MEEECYVHEVSQKLKLTLYEILQNSCNRFDFSHQDYLLRQTQQGTQMVVHDFNFQNIDKIISIGSPWSPQTFSFLQNSETFLAVQGFEENISFINISRQSKRIQKNEISLLTKDKILLITDFLTMADFSLSVAYTAKREFYLIIIKKTGGYQIVKLNNLQDIGSTKFFFSWFNNKVQNFSHINMKLFRVDKYERFVQLLVIRDSHITLHIIELHLENQKSNISLIRALNFQQPMKIHQSIIKEEGEHEQKKLNIFLARQSNLNFLELIKIKVDYCSKETFFSQKLISIILPSNFSFEIFQGDIIYRNYNTACQRYEVFRNKICWLQKKNNVFLQDSNPFLCCQNCPFFKMNDFNLYIICCESVFVVPKQEEISDFSQQQKKWLNFKDTLNNIYSKKIQSLPQKTLQNLILLLTKKQESIILWMKQSRPFLAQEDLHVKEILEMEIVCIKILISFCQTFLYEVNDQIKGQIFEAAINSQPSSIERLIMSILDKNLFSNFFEVITKLKQCNSIYKDSLKVIFEQPMERLSEQFENSQISQSIFLQVVSELAIFQIVQKRHMDLLNFQQTQVAIKKIIISNMMQALFIQYFFSQQMSFTSSQLKHLLKEIKLKNSLKLKKFVCNVLVEMKKIPLGSTLIEFIQILTDSLSFFHDEIIEEIDQILPGLNLLILIKRGQREKILELLSANPFFQELESKNFLYLLIFDILEEKQKIDDHIGLLAQAFFGNLNHKCQSISEKDLKQRGERQFSQITEFQRCPSKKRKK